MNSGLVDLNFRGNTFTWWNKRKSTPVAKKLDRILVNDEWNSLFPSSLGQFGEPCFSDHACCEVRLETASPRRKKPFRFYNFLLKNQKFLPLVCLHWFSFNSVGSSMFRVSQKLKALKHIIREFARQNFLDLEKRTQEAHESLIRAQNRLLSSPTIFNAELEFELNRKWQILSTVEESFFLQRSRVSWLREGDLNTSYFHKMASARQAINHIHYLIDVNGSRIETQSGIHNHCVEYFMNTLGGVQGQANFIQEDITNLLQFKCNEEQQGALDSFFTAKEIRDAFFSLPTLTSTLLNFSALAGLFWELKLQMRSWNSSGRGRCSNSVMQPTLSLSPRSQMHPKCLILDPSLALTLFTKLFLSYWPDD